MSQEMAQDQIKPLAVAQQSSPTPDAADPPAAKSAAQPQATPLPPLTVDASEKKKKSAKVQKAKPGAEKSAPQEGATKTPTTAGVGGEATEAKGYKPDSVANFGPFGQKSLLDVPYSVNVVSSELIENAQLQRPEDVFRISPVIQQGFNSGVARGAASYAMLRGFQQSYAAQDGLRINISDPVSLEDKERVEILTGLSGFLFGATTVGGLVNYVYKRPTSETLANITVGSYGAEQGYVHGDFSGPIDKEGKLSYRLNVVAQDGDTQLQEQSLERQLATLAVDWKIVPGTTLSLLASHHHWEMHGLSAYWVQNTQNGANYFHYGWVPDASLRYSPSRRWSTTRTKLR